MVRLQTGRLMILCAFSSTTLFALLVEPPQTLAAQQTVRAGARIAWHQAPSSDAELASYTFTLYVDGTPTALTGVSCVRLHSGTGYDCVAPLPHLSPGVHTLQVATSTVRGATSVESDRSTPLHVSSPGADVAASRDSGPPSARPPAAVVGGLTMELVASGLLSATDLAFADERLLFVSEYGGTVRVVDDGHLLPEAVLRIEDVQGSIYGGLLSLAVDPQFARNGLLYLVYAFESSEGVLTYRLARFRYVGGVFGEQAVLLDGVPAAADNLTSSLRFGPDGKLYVALGDVRGLRDDLSSYNGKVLRLNPDGTTPRDQRSASPVYVAGLRGPRTMAWRPMDNDLWIVDASPDGSRMLHLSASETGAMAAHALPESAIAASMAFYDKDLIPGFRGDLLLPSKDAMQILRVQFDPARRATVTFHASAFPDVGAARVVAVSPTGEVYFCTADALVRVSPRR